MGLRASIIWFCLPGILALAVAAWPVPGTAQVQSDINSPVDTLLQLQQLQRGYGQIPGSLYGTDQQQQPAVVESALPYQNPLPPSRLEQIISQRAGVKLQQFGYDQLGRSRNLVLPQTGAMQDDYVMGPGDEVVVSLRGQESYEFRTAVNRNGQVTLPRLNPIPASGRSFGSFRQDLEAAVRRSYVATNASVSIGQVRRVSVLVSGEVNIPGQRLVTGLSSAADAILLSGGVKKTGSLRNIRIQRAGREHVVDLYGILTGAGAAGTMSLADGDRIIVPPLGRTVSVTGLVRRPGIYELPARSSALTARALLSLAGGQEVRGQYRLAVQRIEADGRLNLVPLKGENELIRDSEILRVELNADLATSQATLSGGVGLAGQFAVSSGTKLSEVIRAPGALGQAPYTLFGIMVRKDSRTLLRTLMAFTPVAVLNGTEDMELHGDDVIRPITIGESQLLAYVVKTYLDKLAFDQNRIRNPLDTQPDVAAPSVAVNASGVVGATNPFGLPPGQLENISSGQEDFSSVPADVQRANIIALLDVAAPGTRAAYQRSMTAAMGNGIGQYPAQMTSGQAATGQLVPGQVAPGQVAPGQQAAMMARGGTNFAGLQPGGSDSGLLAPGTIGANGQPYPFAGAAVPAVPTAPNYQEQPIAPGAFASNQEVQTFGELSRQLGMDPLVLINFLIDHRARLDGAVRGPGPYFVGPNVSLADLVQAAGGTVSWADESGVELLTTVVDSRNGRSASQRQTLPLRQGTLASYVVRPKDQLHFNKVFTDTGIGSVSVQGEVRFSGNYPITRGEHLSDLLMRAGGLNSTAYPAGTVFLRKSAAQVEEQGYRRTANEIQSQLLAGMARIGNDKISGEGFAAIQSFIGQLRNQKGLGRIAISADPSVLAANPQMDPLLEPGDVVFIPQRPSTITVLGEVMQPGSYTYQRGMKVADYIEQAGGYAQYSDEDLTFLVLPDGSARKLETSWLNFDATTLPPGTSIVVPRDLAPLTARQLLLDITGILSSFAVTAASLAVLAKQ